MHRPSFLSVLATIGFVSGGCPRSGPAERIDPVNEARLVDHGFVLFTNPRDTYGPGTFFRIDRGGGFTIVQDTLSRLLPMRYGDVAIPELMSNGAMKANLGLVLGFLGGAELDAGYQDTVTLGFKLGGAQMEYVPEEEFDTILEEYQRGRYQATPLDPDVVITAAKFRKGSRYFIIRETIRADTMDWRFNPGLVARLGLDGGRLGKKLKLRDTSLVELKRGQEILLTQRFPSRLRVFYRADEIKPLFVADSQTWRRDTNVVRLPTTPPPAPLPATGVAVGEAVTTWIQSAGIITMEEFLTPFADTIRTAVRSLRSTNAGVELALELPSFLQDDTLRLAEARVIGQEWSPETRVTLQSRREAIARLASRWRQNDVLPTIRNQSVDLYVAGSRVRVDTSRSFRIDSVRASARLVAGEEFTIRVDSGRTARTLLTVLGRRYELDPTEVIEDQFVRRVRRSRLPNGDVDYTYRVKTRDSNLVTGD
jgi:hypothetical protein